MAVSKCEQTRRLIDEPRAPPMAVNAEGEAGRITGEHGNAVVDGVKPTLTGNLLHL